MFKTTSDLTLILGVLVFSTFAGFVVMHSGRYSSLVSLLYSYLKNTYPKEYERLINKDGKILTAVSEGGAMYPTETSLFKSRIGHQFAALNEIAAINPQDEELHKQISSLKETLKVTRSIIYGTGGVTLFILVGWYVNVAL